MITSINYVVKAANEYASIYLQLGSILDTG